MCQSTVMQNRLGHLSNQAICTTPHLVSIVTLPTYKKHCTILPSAVKDPEPHGRTEDRRAGSMHKGGTMRVKVVLGRIPPAAAGRGRCGAGHDDRMLAVVDR